MLDGDKMKQAISILCKNAEEAMPGGGRLTISGRVCEQEKVIVVKVTDTESGVLEGPGTTFEILLTLSRS